MWHNIALTFFQILFKKRIILYSISLVTSFCFAQEAILCLRPVYVQHIQYMNRQRIWYATVLYFFIRLLNWRHERKETSASLCTSICRNHITRADWDCIFLGPLQWRRFCIFCKLNVILCFLSLFVLDRRKDLNEYADKILWNVKLDRWKCGSESEIPLALFWIIEDQSGITGT